MTQAVEQYEAIKRKEDEAGGELRGAQAILATATSAFNDTEARRLDTFNRAFDHVCQHIDPIFKVFPPVHPWSLVKTKTSSCSSNEASEPNLQGSGAFHGTRRQQNMWNMCFTQRDLLCLSNIADGSASRAERPK